MYVLTVRLLPLNWVRVFVRVELRHRYHCSRRRIGLGTTLRQRQMTADPGYRGWIKGSVQTLSRPLGYSRKYGNLSEERTNIIGFN